MNYEQLKARIETLAASEKVTKELLAALSRDLLQFMLDTGDIRPINLLLEDGKLSPQNRKVAILYFQKFCPFKNLQTEKGEFQAFGEIKKAKKEEKFASVREFLADPHNNIWTWANRHVEVKSREFKIDRVTATVQKAIENGFSPTSILVATLKAGISVNDIMDLVSKMADMAEQQEQEEAKIEPNLA